MTYPHARPSEHYRRKGGGDWVGFYCYFEGQKEDFDPVRVIQNDRTEKCCYSLWL
jgi:hypothetical protein